MIIGNQERFAIEADIEQQVDGWVLGRFRFWMCGRPVGSWDDSVDLKGCVRWLRDLHEGGRDRYEPGLYPLSPEEVFRRVFDPVMAGSADRAHPMRVEDAYGRFHISHLGMSSFDRIDLLLLKDEQGAERCLWREAGSGQIVECHLWRNEMERVAAEFCERFEREMATINDGI